MKTIFLATRKWITVLNVVEKSSKLIFFMSLGLTCAGIGDHCESLFLDRKSHWSELGKERKMERQMSQVEKIPEVGCV